MSEHSYTYLERTLHALALNPMVAEVSFDLEKALHGKGLPAVQDRPHVFVSGLARAGTTILMRELHGTGQFRSLTYRDMPFVMAPNFWQGISGKSQKQAEAQERAHGDGLEHSFDSPEALEEVFWRVMAGEEYLRDDRLIPMVANEEVLEAFRTYVALILKATPEMRYLSKNNNHILRLGSLAKAFPQAVLLVPFREPVAHATSLLTQHGRFRETHAGDAFALKYMRWLAHHEFGADQRPFVFSGEAPDSSETDHLTYWIRLWVHVYESLLKSLPGTAVLVSYERLCTESETVWQAICERAYIEPVALSETLRAPKMATAEGVEAALLERAGKLHEELLARSLG